MTVAAITVTIDRPPSVVFDFCVVHHLENHPRWDPKMELRQLTDGPIGVGTRFHRRHTHFGTPVEGIMEVVELEPERSFGAVVLDQTPNGPLEIRSRMTLEPRDEGRTGLTIQVDLPASEGMIDRSMIEGSLRRIKELVEAETQATA